MFRYRLRTLLILLAIGPPMLAGAWWMVESPAGHETLAEAFVTLAVCSPILLAIGGILIAVRDRKNAD